LYGTRSGKEVIGNISVGLAKSSFGLSSKEERNRVRGAASWLKEFTSQKTTEKRRPNFNAKVVAAGLRGPGGKRTGVSGRCGNI
jgi:hypothetical protein